VYISAADAGIQNVIQSEAARHFIKVVVEDVNACAERDIQFDDIICLECTSEVINKASRKLAKKGVLAVLDTQGE
jgi:hypothetical protein